MFFSDFEHTSYTCNGQASKEEFIDKGKQGVMLLQN